MRNSQLINKVKLKEKGLSCDQAQLQIVVGTGLLMVVLTDILVNMVTDILGAVEVVVVAVSLLQVVY
jgi:hypothetical protein